MTSILSKNRKRKKKREESDRDSLQFSSSMGNYKFRLSDMIPNAWFYKLKDMSRTRNSHPTKKTQSSSSTASQKPPVSRPKQSFYYTWESTRGDQRLMNSPRYSKASDVYFPDPPRRSSKRRSRRKTIYKPSPRRVTSFVPAECRCHASSAPSQDYYDSSTDASLEFGFLKSPSSEFESDTFDGPESFNGVASRSSTCSCGFSSSATDIIIDVNEKSFCRNFDKLDAFDAIPELDLPPILTKPAKLNEAPKETANFCSSPQLEDIEALGSLSIKIVKEERTKTRKETTKTSPGSRKSVSHSAGIKLRANSPKLASKKIQGQGRKSISKLSKSQKKPSFSESFAVVKASLDPQKDFRDSMMEMIVENNIRASKDLEELLACYLSLNSDEYHELIIKAFEQIWFNMPDLQL